MKPILSAQPSAEMGLSTADALMTLLTVESLLFTALSVGVALAGATEFGRNLPTSATFYAGSIAFVITLLAVGAGAAWLGAYADSWPSDGREVVAALAIAVGIVAEVVFAWWIVRAIKGS